MPTANSISTPTVRPPTSRPESGSVRHESVPVSSDSRADIQRLMGSKMGANRNKNYRQLLDYREQHDTGWNDHDMQLVAGISTHNASVIRKERAPLTEHQTEIREEALGHHDSGARAGEKYRTLLDYNRQHQKGWADADMQRAAGITVSAAANLRHRMPHMLTPEQQDIRTEVFGDTPTSNASDRYRQLLDYNRGHQKGWNDSDMQRVADIRSEYASLIRKRQEPLTQQQRIISDLVPGDTKSTFKTGHYQRILDYNEQYSMGWQDSDMRHVAGIDWSNAASIRRKRQATDTPTATLTQKHPRHAPGIKTEPGESSRLSAAYLEEVPLDMARTAFQARREVADLTGEQVIWSMQHDADNRVIVHHAMDPDPAMDNVFPIRDPADPRRPHSYYADDSGNIGRTQIKEVGLMRGMASYLYNLAQDERSKPAGEQRLNLSRGQVQQAISGLRQSVLAELKRTLQGEPAESPAVEVRRMNEADVAPHEKALIGQYGLFVADGPDATLPTFTNGRILGLYAGARLETEQEYQQHNDRYGAEEVNRYALDTTRSVTLSPLGGANAMAFANTALDPADDVPAYDHRRLNATFMPFTVNMQDRVGRPRTETVMAIVAFDNIHGQILVDYGDEYLQQFETRDAPMPFIKQESPS